MGLIWYRAMEVVLWIKLGSWSSSNSGKNNVVNAFNYYANDTILVTYDPEEQKIVFNKKGTEESHTLEYEPV